MKTLKKWDVYDNFISITTGKIETLQGNCDITYYPTFFLHNQFHWYFDETEA
jgi:hypothetical protein